MNGVSVFRLNLLRVFYAVLFFGLGTFIWPEVIQHTNSFAIAYGVRFSLLAGLGALAGLGLRYPLQMLPLAPLRAALESNLSYRVCPASLPGTRGR